MKKLILILYFALFFISINAQQVINLLTGDVRDGRNAATPTKTVKTLDDGYLVTWNFTEAILENDDIYPNCKFCRIPCWQKHWMRLYPFPQMPKRQKVQLL